MAREDMVMASQEELKRLHVVRKVQEKLIKQVEAGEVLGLSSRQVRRIGKRVGIEGDEGSFIDRGGGVRIGHLPIR